MDDLLLRTLLDETIGAATRRVAVPTMLAGTVIDANDTTGVVVLVDGDTEPITVASIVGPLRVAERVMVRFEPPSGARSARGRSCCPRSTVRR